MHICIQIHLYRLLMPLFIRESVDMHKSLFKDVSLPSGDYFGKHGNHEQFRITKVKLDPKINGVRFQPYKISIV